MQLTTTGHWGDTKTGLYYNGYHHDEVTKTDQLGVESKRTSDLSLAST